jgi:beta-xylosidase
MLQWYAINSFAQPADTVKPLTYKNPLPVAFGDPFVLQESITYYMYGTGGGAEKGFAAYSSTDLINWKFEGQVYYGNNENGWGTGDYWAPEVFKRNGRYYMFYSAQWKEKSN